HLDEREVALAFLRRTNLAGDGIAGLQVELANLRRRDVDVVRSGQIVVVGRAQEAEAVRQHLEDALGKDEAALLGLRFQDLKDQILLPHASRAGDGEILRDLGELLNAHVLQIGDVQTLTGATRLLLLWLVLRWRRRLRRRRLLCLSLRRRLRRRRVRRRRRLCGGTGFGIGGLGWSGGVGGGRSVRGPRRRVALMMTWHGDS